jgi:hypothetical protein
MSDLISRLRGDGYLLLNIHERQTLDYEAAYELDRLNGQALELCAELSGLRRENERLRELLLDARDMIRAGIDDYDGVQEDALVGRIDAALAGAAVQPEASLSQRMAAAGYTRRPKLPSDADDRDDEVTANPTKAAP